MVEHHSPAPSSGLTVLYDADCGFCRATARWLQRRDRAGRLAFMPLQQAARASQPVIVAAAAVHDLQAVLHVVDEGSGAVHGGGAAILAVLDVLPRWHALARVTAAGPWRGVVGPVYEVVAGQRERAGRLLGVGGTSCHAEPGRRP